MHESQEKFKMFVGDGGQFLEKCALEFDEISWEYYHHPYASPHEKDTQMDALCSRYDIRKFMLCVF